MTVHFDDKGKIFTNIVSKDAVPAIIQTLTHRIRGFIYIRQGDRIKDELSRSEQFIAVTNATIFDAEGEELFRSGFLVVNRDHVVWMIPDEEISSEIGSGGAQ
jgi:hypothetical protein